MSKLPVVSGRECVAALLKLDFYEDRQRVSHIILLREEHAARVVVPDHKELKRGTLRAIIRQAGLTVDEFVALL